MHATDVRKRSYDRELRGKRCTSKGKDVEIPHVDHTEGKCSHTDAMSESWNKSHQTPSEAATLYELSR